MTAEQIKLLRSQLNRDNGNGKPVANSVFYDMDNGMAFRNSHDFVIFDDASELIHCISANRNATIKDETPYSMISTSYEHLQFIEANLTKDGLFTILEDIIGGLVSEANMTMIKNWADNLPVHPISRFVGNYHHDPNPQVPQMPTTPTTREDGAFTGYPVKNGKPQEKPIISMIYSSGVIPTIEAGSSVILTGTSIQETAVLDKDDVTLIGSRMSVEQGMNVSGNGITLSGFNFTTEDMAKDEKLLDVAGDNFTMQNCMFTNSRDVTTRNPVAVKAKTMLIEDCVFDGEGGVYNCIESVYNQATCKDITFRNCTFMPGAASNNFVSLYKFEDGAVITFDNCTFVCNKDTNPIRISNIGSNTATINIINCKYKSIGWATYSGLILFQDSTGDQDMSKITVNIRNLTTTDGAALIKNNGPVTDVDKYPTLDATNRIWYTYNCTSMPVVNIS